MTLQKFEDLNVDVGDDIVVTSTVDEPRVAMITDIYTEYFNGEKRVTITYQLLHNGTFGSHDLRFIEPLPDRVSTMQTPVDS
jgi:hypothetical protein